MGVPAPPGRAAVLRTVTEDLDHGMLWIEHGRKSRHRTLALFYCPILVFHTNTWIGRWSYDTPALTVGAGSRVSSSSS